MPIRVSNVTSQILFNPAEIFQTVNDPITFTEEPFARKLRVSNTTFQVLQLQDGQFSFATNTLALTDTVLFLNDAGSRQAIFDTLALTDEANAPQHPFITDVLAFTQVGRPSIWNIDLLQDIFLHDHVGTCSGAPWSAISITDTLEFVDVAGQAWPVTVTDPITFSDLVETSTAPDGGGHFIDFAQSVSAGLGYELTSELVFTHVIQSFSDFLRSATDANVVEHAMTYYIDSGCNRKQYARFVGEGTAEGLNEQRLVFDASFVLESISDGTVLILRSPETDDGDRLGFNRINRESRGGELNVFSDPNWAEVNTLLFTVTALPGGKGNCPDTIESLLTFMQDNLGKEIYLHDWTGTSWRGVITVPDEAATEDADGWWTVSFEFEGIASEGGVPQSSLSITQTMTMNADWNRSLSDTLVIEDTAHAGGSIYLSLADTLSIADTITGTQEITVLHDNHGSGATSVTLDGQSPDTGSGTWRAHTNYLDDGTMAANTNAGAYYAFTPVDGTVYELTFSAANVVTYSSGENCIFGFFEGIAANNSIVGSTADGTFDPTAAKAVHLMRETGVSTRNNAYRRGADSDGTADTVAWTDVTLNASPDAVLDLRITLDTTGGAGNWTAQWEAKGVISPTYTEVGPATALLSENIGAVGWSNDSSATKSSLDQIRLTELRPV